MANTKGNAYPLWGVNSNYQIFAADTNHQEIAMSNEDFAMDVAVSEDGTVWALSTVPDPDGGGAKLFWGNGTNQWKEINTSDPGGVSIAGYLGDSCLYKDTAGNLRSMNTAGESKLLFHNPALIDFDYGGGYLWAVFPKATGEIPILQFASSSNDLQFKVFSGDVSPTSIAVDYAGNGHGVVDYSPMTYSKDGHSAFSAGADANGATLAITYKNWSYILSTDVNEHGNVVCIWEDQAGGLFQKTNLRASVIETTYYSGNR
ncbi:MAG: hypothetical protein AAF433_17015 [Bacteroidota bacterium]